jgi:hypothetical protein
VNSEKLTGIAKYLPVYTRCHINQCRYNRVTTAIPHRLVYTNCRATPGNQVTSCNPSLAPGFQFRILSDTGGFLNLSNLQRIHDLRCTEASSIWRIKYPLLFFEPCIEIYIRNVNQQDANFFFTNDSVQLCCLRHVSNTQVFIIRETVQATLRYCIMLKL